MSSRRGGGGGGGDDIAAILAAADGDGDGDGESAPVDHRTRRKTLVVQAQRRKESGESSAGGLPHSVARARGGSGAGPQVCAVFRRTGKCPFGTKCPYEHTLADPSPSPSTARASSSPSKKQKQKKPPTSSSSSSSSSSPKPHAEHGALSAAQLQAQASAMADLNRQYELTSLNSALDNTLTDVNNMLLKDGGGGGRGSERVSPVARVASPHRGGQQPTLGPIAENSRSSFSFGSNGRQASSLVAGGRRGRGGSGDRTGGTLDQSFDFSSRSPAGSPQRFPLPQADATKQQLRGNGNGGSGGGGLPTTVAGRSAQEILALVVKNDQPPLQRVFGWTHGRLNPDACHLWSQNDTALHYCACYNSDLVAEMLLELSANPNSRNLQQQTPVHFAGQYDSAAVLDKLLVAKAQVHAHNLIGQTPLHYAARFGAVTALALLLHAKGDPNVPNQTQQRPMHYAFKHNRAHVASLLLDAGGDETTHKINGRHQTPLELGRASKSVETLAMYDEFKRSGFLPVTVDAALMRFRRRQDAGGGGGAGAGDDADAKLAAEMHAEVQRLRAELQQAKDAGAAHEVRAAELEERVADLMAEVRQLRRSANNDDLDLHFERWHCFMCCLPKDLKVIPHGQLRTVKVSRGDAATVGGGGSSKPRR